MTSIRHAQRVVHASGLATVLRCGVAVLQSFVSAAPEPVLARLASGSANCSSSGGQQHAPGFHSSPGAWRQDFSARSFASSAAGADQAMMDAEYAGMQINSGMEEQYTQIGRITGKYHVPRKLAFAVVEVGPTQFRVSQGDTIVTEKLRGVDVNDKISLNRVLMLGSRHETIIGRPFIPAASVTAAVEEQFQDGKALIFKKRRRKHSRRMNGHRQDLTTLRILEVEGIEAEAPSLEGSKAPWWEGRKSAAKLQPAVAAAVSA